MTVQYPSESERIREAVLSELMKNHLLEGENILVDVEGDEVILGGDVGSIDQKWLAEDIANTVYGVLHVSNEIEVVEDMAPEATRKTKGERQFGIDAGLS